MKKKIRSHHILQSLCIAFLFFSSSLAPLPAQAQTGSRSFQLIAGCDNDSAAVQAISTSVASALAQNRPDNDQRYWRIYSICQTGSQGYVYIKSYSSANGQPLPAASDVALVLLTEGSWQTLLPEAGADYNRLLATMPLISPEAAQQLLRPPLANGTPLYASGYALPWPAGQTAVSFKHWYPAMDFSVQSSNTIRSAKGGTVMFVKDSSTRQCGDPPPDWTCWQWANAIVIQSGPSEYVWYMHFATYSIPDWIQEGVYVPGGTDLGQQGSTGWASGPHVHFMVASTYSCCIGTGDSRLPDWPNFTTYGVDFYEYTWDQIPWLATSQNGQNAPPPPANDPPPQTISYPSDPAPTTTTANIIQSGCPSPYTIQGGEWLYRIASKCGVAVAELIAANPGINPDAVYPGQQLHIPGGGGGGSVQVLASPPSSGSCSGTHTVAGGENLFRIGYNCGFSAEQMAMVNGLAYPYSIYPGQVLHYP